MKKNDHSLSYYLCDKNPWTENGNPIWLASSINIFRNLNKFNFPGKLTTESQKTISVLVGDEILKSEVLKSPKLFKAEQMEPIDKEFINERFLSTEGFYQAHAGEAFVLDESGIFLATINIQDHIHLQFMSFTGNLQKSWNYLMRIETNLGKIMNFAFSQRFGFLTSDPSLCGTAMQVHIFLQLPALIHTEVIDEILEETVDDTLSITGLHGNPTEVIGDILAVKNNHTLGVTEDAILSSLEAFATKLMARESLARKEIKSSQNSEIKDRISRAYAILIHSYQIEAIEALNALSLVKLGIDLGWVEGMTIQQVNALFFTCRRAHFLCHFDQPISQEELPHRRAEFIHEALKNIKLKI